MKSELGQTRHFDRASVTSGLPQSTDILRVRRPVSKVCHNRKSMALSADWVAPLLSIAFDRHAEIIIG
jgi:hypothetical protein